MLQKSTLELLAERDRALQVFQELYPELSRAQKDAMLAQIRCLDEELGNRQDLWTARVVS